MLTVAKGGEGNEISLLDLELRNVIFGILLCVIHDVMSDLHGVVYPTHVHKSVMSVTW